MTLGPGDGDEIVDVQSKSEKKHVANANAVAVAVAIAVSGRLEVSMLLNVFFYVTDEGQSKLERLYLYCWKSFLA
jgi:hypothetical protein